MPSAVHGGKNQSSLRIVAKRVSERSTSLPAAAHCHGCDAWKVHCIGVEMALKALEARLQVAQQHVQSPPEMKAVGIQAGLQEKCEDIGVQVSLQDSMPQTLNRGCQTHWTPCRRCRSSDQPVIMKETGVQVHGLVRRCNVATETDPVERCCALRPREVATQTADCERTKRDLGCSVVLQDEEHSCVRQELLGKIDALLEELQQARLEAADTQRTNGKLQVHLESVRCEQAFHTARPRRESQVRPESCKENEHDIERPKEFKAMRPCKVAETAAQECQNGLHGVRPALHEVWAEFQCAASNGGWSEQEGESGRNHDRQLDHQGVALESACLELDSPVLFHELSKYDSGLGDQGIPADSLDSCRLFGRVGISKPQRVVGGVAGATSVLRAAFDSGRHLGSLAGAAQNSRATATDASRKSASTRAAHILMNTPRVPAELQPSHAHASRLKRDVGRLPHQLSARLCM